MKPRWHNQALDKVCLKIQDGAHHSPKRTYTERGNDRFLYVTSKNIRNGYMDLSNVEFVDSSFHESIYPRCNPELGDVLLTKDGANTGNVAINTLDEPFSMLSSVCLLKVDSGKITSKFLMYYLQSKDGFEQITGKMTGAAIKRIILKTIKNSTMPAPPLPEQKRIVAILDEAFEGIDRAIANTEKNLANARELFSSHLNATFGQRGSGWTEKRLETLIDIEHGYAFDGNDFETSSDPGKYIVLTPGNYSEQAELYFTVKNTKRYCGTPPANYVFAEGDLTVVMTDLSSKMKILGKPAFVNQPNILHNQRIGRVRPKSHDLSLQLLYFFLRTNIVSKEIKRTATGTMVRHTAPKRILSIVMPFPRSVGYQEALAAKLHAFAAETRQLEEAYRQKLSSLNTLKQAILQKAFAGELTARSVENLHEAAQ